MRFIRVLLVLVLLVPSVTVASPCCDEAPVDDCCGPMGDCPEAPSGACVLTAGTAPVVSVSSLSLEAPACARITAPPTVALPERDPLSRADALHIEPVPLFLLLGTLRN